jgi:hypothetical protein
MAHITLTEEQARVVLGASETIELREASGKVLTRAEPPITEAEIAEAKRRLASTRRWWPAARVQELMAALAEVRAREGMEEGKLQQLVAQFRPGLAQ